MSGLILPLFHLSFWFHARTLPVAVWIETLLALALFVFLIGGGICALLANAPADRKAVFGKRFDTLEREMLRRSAACALSASLVGWMLFFLLWQEVPYLSSRVFWLLWLIGFGVWAWRIERYARQTVPAQRAAQAERAAYEKWLPKSKKRSA